MRKRIVDKKLFELFSLINRVPAMICDSEPTLFYNLMMLQLPTLNLFYEIEYTATIACERNILTMLDVFLWLDRQWFFWIYSKRVLFLEQAKLWRNHQIMGGFNFEKSSLFLI